MDKPKHTEGIWRISYQSPNSIIDASDAIAIITDEWNIAAVFKDAGNSGYEPEANAKLIVEAANVASETGKSPQQLADERQKLLDALIGIYKSCNPKRFGVQLLKTDLSSVGQVTMPSEESILNMCRAIRDVTS